MTKEPLLQGTRRELEWPSSVYLDVHKIGVIFVGERDDEINQIGLKGVVGEVGASAVFHARGKRLRE